MSGRTTKSATSWRLSIDLGTSFTAAATERGGRITTVLFDGSPRIASVVAVDEHGSLVVAGVAEQEMALAPERAERCPKRRLGDSVMLLGDTSVSPVDAVAAVLRYVFDEAVRQSGGARPVSVVLTHPARWGSVRLGLLAEAARRVGLPEPDFVSEPVAAAAAESDAAALGDGQVAAVFDIGGGTFDTAVVRRVGDSFEVVGPPGGNDRIGGETFDERIFVYLGELLARTQPEAWELVRFSDERTWRRAAYDLRVAARSAKETLSTRVDAAVYLGAPIDAELRFTRDEFERLIEADMHAAVAELAATVDAAGLSPSDLRSVFLVGGSGRVPMAARLVGEWFGRVPITWGDPKGAVVLGALMVDPLAMRRLSGVAPTIEMPLTAALPAAPAAAATSQAVSAASAPPGSATAVPKPMPMPKVDRRRLGIIVALVTALVLLGGTAYALIGRDGTGPGSGSPPASTRAAALPTAGTTPVPATTTAPATTAASTVPTTTAASTTAATTAMPTTTVLATTGAPTTTAARSGPAATPTVTVRTAPVTTVAAAEPVTTTAPPPVSPTTQPPPPPPPPTTAATSNVVPNVNGATTTAAASAIQQAGFAGTSVVPGTCDLSSIVTSHTPSGQQPLSSTINIRCD